jgi:O-antigen/teichoic acid export membrane protein
VGAYVTQMLAVATLVAFIAAPWYYGMVGRGRYRDVMLGSVATLVANLTCTLALTPRLGVTGALIGSILGSTLMVTVWWLVLREEGNGLFRPAVRPYLAVGIVTCAALVVTESWKPSSWLTLCGAVAAFVAVAIAALRLAGVFVVRIEGRRYTFAFPASDET